MKFYYVLLAFIAMLNIITSRHLTKAKTKELILRCGNHCFVHGNNNDCKLNVNLTCSQHNLQTSCLLHPAYCKWSGTNNECFRKKWACYKKCHEVGGVCNTRLVPLLHHRR